jgi:two-component system cell cycle sensor histidine kinase/response regulator CckA
MGLNGEKTPLILCVDDEPVVLDVSRMALERNGFRVKTAIAREQAVWVVERAPEAVSVVILDWMMPGMEIGEVISRLKRLSPELKLVLSSGYDRATAKVALAPATVDGFLQKPFTPKQLAQTVQRVLRPVAAGSW